jgi:hypothetical protein
MLPLLVALAHAAPVTLVDATLTPTDLDPGSYCPSCYDFAGTVEVENLAYDKDVEIWFTANGYSWDAVYDGPTTATHEQWSFELELGYVYPRRVQFAVRYEVGGTVYWDNNAGIDYVVGPVGLLEDAPVELVGAEKGIGLGCYGQCADFEVHARVAAGPANRVWLYYRVDGGRVSRQALNWVSAANDGYEWWTTQIPYLNTRDPLIEFGLMLQTPSGRTVALDDGVPWSR